MTTFTKISSGETSKISIDPSARLSDIDPMIYGGFIEHMGRAVYGGIYDPGNPLSDEDGFRKDVLEALGELKVPVVRYPGGNFVATYHWLDGVGPKEKRPARRDLAWGGRETNEFGTDEFLKWCSKLGTEPFFALNFGTGTLDEALGWLEYCNSSSDTYYANLRRKNGREEPYNVEYWALGNEMWGPWQIGQMTKEAYAHQAVQWAKALKNLDPSIILILCGQDGVSTWDQHVIQASLLPAQSALSLSPIPLIDMHSIHMYTASSAHYPNAFAPLAAERAIQITSSLIDLALITNNVPGTSPHRPKICFDEWNVWDPNRAVGSLGAEERYTLSDALAVGIWLNVFVRQSREVGMACIAQSVNVISPLMTTGEGLVRQTTWWPLWLFCRFMRGTTVGVRVWGETYEGPVEPGWMRKAVGGDVAWLDVSACVDGEGWVGVCVVNVHEEKGFEVELDVGVEGGKGGEVQVYTVTGEGVNATNMNGKEEVGVQESTWDGKGKFTFPKHSLTMLRWKA
ncbi:hypothetical protein MMC25_007143 [Agyrium rufum]|nr:hypothetical protein [Agyrium rufum]